MQLSPSLHLATEMPAVITGFQARNAETASTGTMAARSRPRKVVLLRDGLSRGHSCETSETVIGLSYLPSHELEFWWQSRQDCPELTGIGC